MTKTINSADLKPIPYEFTPKGVAPQPLTPIDREFKKIIKVLTSVTEPDNRPFTVRASGMPVCAWAVMLSELYGDNPPPATTAFLSEFYKNIGTTVHEVIQKWLVHTGNLYGSFYCRQCRSSTLSLGAPKICINKCSNPEWQYREIPLNDLDPSGVFASAKADGLLHFDWMEPDHYYLIDFKTCSINSLPKVEYGLSSKYHQKYLYQTAIYTHLLARMDENIHIDGTVLLFIPRDDPKLMTAILVDQSETNGDIYRQTVRGVRAGREASKTGDTTAVKRDCQTKDDNPDCRFRQACWDRQLTKELFAQHKLLPILPDF